MRLGKAFSDFVIEERRNEGRFATPTPSWWLGAGRALLFASVLIVSFFLLIFRLFSLTVLSGHTYRILADGNRTRELIRHAPRGIILDRTGKPLVENIAQYRLLKPCEHEGTVSTKLCVTYIGKEEGEQLLSQGLPAQWFLEVDYSRRYMYPESIAHVMGYLSQITKEELDDEYYTLRGYKMGDLVGRSGAEAVFEQQLRGRDGKELVEIDAGGKILRTLGREMEIPGETITLSLDAGLSEAAKNAFPQDKKGAIIVAKPQTGEILTLFSSPTFSSETLTRGLSSTSYEALVNNPDRPLFDRAIGGVYPPGSTFKLVTGIGALEDKAITRGTIVEDTGEIKIGPYVFPNWFFKQYGKTDGSVDIVKALQRSNDIFFYKAGEFLGITKLGIWARRIGIGAPVGIELPGEASGLMPGPQWKNERFSSDEDKRLGNNEWYLGDTYHVAIGQGYLLTTPLQVNTWTNVVANGGKRCRPTIEKVKSSVKCENLNIAKETIDLVTEGMKRACAPGGTGYPLFDFGIRKMKLADGSTVATSTGELVKIPVACKTGTAEFGDPTNKTHAWFTSFAPVPDDSVDGTGRVSLSSNIIVSGEPELSVTVLVEGAGEGSDKAAPLAKKLYEEWFSR